MKRAGALLVAASLLVAAAPARNAGAGYQPVDKDERGLWMQAEEYERQLKTSNFVIRDPALNGYVRDVFCRAVGQVECAPVRIYVMRTPYFNASMAINGTMQIWSGLFLRARDEAQLAAVLSHEYVHYANLHGLKSFRDIKGKTSAMAWLGFVPFGFIASLGVAGSIFSFNRDMEREADTASVAMIARAGYDPSAASAIWQQLRAEMDATAAARGKKSRKDKDRGMFQTHPPTAERMTELAALAARQPKGDARLERGRYRAALGEWWARFVDDQVKLNDFGGTELLLAALATEGWTGELLFAKGELYRARGRPEDLSAAATAFRDALRAGGAPAEAHRGLGLVLLRSGAKAEGAAALRDYVRAKPDASDKAMIESMVEGMA